jgi:hypothetical protein
MYLNKQVQEAQYLQNDLQLIMTWILRLCDDVAP